MERLNGLLMIGRTCELHDARVMRGGNGSFRADDLPVGLNGVDDVKTRGLPIGGRRGNDGACGMSIVCRWCDMRACDKEQSDLSIVLGQDRLIEYLGNQEKRGSLEVRGGKKLGKAKIDNHRWIHGGVWLPARKWLDDGRRMEIWECRAGHPLL